MAQDDCTSWADITLTEMMLAFRKAKADCFFERSICISHLFAQFEEDLVANLEAILDIIHSGEIEKYLLEHLAPPKIAAKKLSVKPQDTDSFPICAFLQKMPKEIGHGLYKPSAGFGCGRIW